MLHEWVNCAEVDTELREGVTTSNAQRIKERGRENKELRQAYEILKLASAFVTATVGRETAAADIPTV